MDIDVIMQHAVGIQLHTVVGGCPRKKLTMLERCIGGDVTDVAPDDLTEEDFVNAQITYVLKVEVGVKRARYDFERSWRWEPGEISYGRICFYHTDYAKLHAYTAKWLLDHADHDAIADKRGHKPYGIKCQPIGRLYHHSTPPEYT